MAQEPTNEKQWSAKHRFARISPRKTRLVVGLIRGRRCSDAVEQLRFNPNRAAVYVRNVLKSAMTNADEQEADMRRLVVKEAWVDAGPVHQRWKPKDRGRAHAIAKRTSHIVVVVGEK